MNGDFPVRSSFWSSALHVVFIM